MPNVQRHRPARLFAKVRRIAGLALRCACWPSHGEHNYGGAYTIKSAINPEVYSFRERVAAVTLNFPTTDKQRSPQQKARANDLKQHGNLWISA